MHGPVISHVSRAKPWPSLHSKGSSPERASGLGLHLLIPLRAELVCSRPTGEDRPLFCFVLFQRVKKMNLLVTVEVPEGKRVLGGDLYFCPVQAEKTAECHSYCPFNSEPPHLPSQAPS